MKSGALDLSLFSLMVNARLPHPLTFMLQNYDANILRTRELHWQLS